MPFKTRIQDLLARSPGPASTPTAPPDLTLTKEEIAAILAARFQKQVEQDGAPTALRGALAAAKKEIQNQVRRAILTLAALQRGLALVLGVLLLVS